MAISFDLDIFEVLFSSIYELHYNMSRDRVAYSMKRFNENMNEIQRPHLLCTECWLQGRNTLWAKTFTFGDFLSKYRGKNFLSFKIVR